MELFDVSTLLTEDERRQVKAGGVAIDLTPKLMAARIAAGNKSLYLMSGTWSVSSLDFKGYQGGLVGDGMTATVLKARSIVKDLIDARDVTDAVVSPFQLKRLTIDGSGKAANLVAVEHRHHYRIEDALLHSATAACLTARDSWLSIHSNVRFQMAPRGVLLLGSNHRSGFYGCSFVACSAWHLEVRNEGSSKDGNEAILLSNCDVEFGDRVGGGIRFDGSSMSIDGYIGENIDGPVLQVLGGTVHMTGTLYYGHQPAAIGVDCQGGQVFVSAKLNGQVYGGFQTLAAGNGGKVIFRDCLSSTPLGGDQTLNGDPLGYGPAYPVFAGRLGRSMSVEAADGVTVERVESGNSMTCTCTALANGARSMTLVNRLVPASPEWRVGEQLYLIVVYSSDKELTVRLVGTDTRRVVVVGKMPATGGSKRTYVKLDSRIPSFPCDRLEFRTDAATVGCVLTIDDCVVADSRMLNAVTGTFGNLYKV